MQIGLCLSPVTIKAVYKTSSGADDCRFDKGNLTLCVLRDKTQQVDEGGRTGLSLTPGPSQFGAVSMALRHKLEQPQRTTK